MTESTAAPRSAIAPVPPVARRRPGSPLPPSLESAASKLSLRRRALTARCTTCRLHGRLCSLRMNHADRCVPAPRPLHHRTAGGRRWECRSARGGLAVRAERVPPVPLTADDARSLYVGVVSGAPHTQWTARKSRRRVRGARTPATPVAAGRRPLRACASRVPDSRLRQRPDYGDSCSIPETAQ